MSTVFVVVDHSSASSLPIGNEERHELKPIIHHQEEQHHYNEFNHGSAVHISEDTKPVHLQHPELNEGVSSHLKTPTPRSFHMDMRFNPYSRPPYPLNSVTSSFMPAHSHVYPSCSIPQSVYPSYQSNQSGYPSFNGTSQGFGYPTGMSTATMVGSLPSDTHTSSELHNMDAAHDHRPPTQ